MAFFFLILVGDDNCCLLPIPFHVRAVFGRRATKFPHRVTNTRCPSIRTTALFRSSRGPWCSASDGKSDSCRCPRPRHRRRLSGTRTRLGAWPYPVGNPSAMACAVLLAVTIRPGRTTRTRAYIRPPSAPPVSSSLSTRPLSSFAAAAAYRFHWLLSPALSCWIPLPELRRRSSFSGPASGTCRTRKKNEHDKIEINVGKFYTFL